jgi:oligoribonuclease NrnB/cAMP/cGMP phosphodiesterase (DHH superfamily)
MIRVWYHSNCYDGFGAAWAARLGLGKDPGIIYAACSYGYPPPEYGPDDTIYIVDFSFAREVLLEIKAKCKNLLVLDHHKTAEEALKGLDFCVFDMERSGAGLTWDQFYQDDSYGYRPKLIQHIEDRDLWRFKIDGSKEVHAYLCAHPFDFDVWDRIANDLEKDAQRIYDAGAILLRAKEMEVAKTCKAAWIGSLGQHRVAIVNTSAHWSEVGHQLLQQFPEAQFAASFTTFSDQVMWSLRGRGDFDVSEVAKRFGGGGHKSAAGFKIKTGEPWPVTWQAEAPS